MPSLRQELEERDAADLAAILEQDPDRADGELAAMWQAVLDRRDPVEILGNAVLWCSQAVLAGAAAECVRLIVGRVRKEHLAPMTALLETVERCSRGRVALEDVWDATQVAKSHVEDAVTEAVVEAGAAAGARQAGFDDEAINSAGCAVMAVIEIGGEGMRDSVVEILARRIPSPTVAAFHAAHAARWS